MYHRNNPHCLHSARFSTILEPTEKLIDHRPEKYPYEPAAAWDEVVLLPGKMKSNVGAGYCHIVNVALLRKNHDGLYQNPDKRIDWSWEKRYQKAKSDMHFRKKLGREAIPLPTQYHLQHIRDNEAGKRLNTQR